MGKEKKKERETPILLAGAKTNVITRNYFGFPMKIKITRLYCHVMALKLFKIRHGVITAALYST